MRLFTSYSAHIAITVCNKTVVGYYFILNLCFTPFIIIKFFISFKLNIHKYWGLRWCCLLKILVIVTYYLLNGRIRGEIVVVINNIVENYCHCSDNERIRAALRMIPEILIPRAPKNLYSHLMALPTDIADVRLWHTMCGESVRSSQVS